jgi:hypothetical protein
MDDFLTILKSRLQDAQKWMQEAQQKLAVAQNEFQRASQEYNSWNYAFAVETQRAAQAANGTKPTTQPGMPRALPQHPGATALIEAKPEAKNKTELVRTFLKQHPNGATPTDIWENLKSEMDRAYIYSVLKRLKDKDEIQERRGKYYFKHRPEADEDTLKV